MGFFIVLLVTIQYPNNYLCTLTYYLILFHCFRRHWEVALEVEGFVIELVSYFFQRRGIVLYCFETEWSRDEPPNYFHKSEKPTLNSLLFPQIIFKCVFLLWDLLCLNVWFDTILQRSSSMLCLWWCPLPMVLRCWWPLVVSWWRCYTS
jgi:hypothetical protein